MPAINTVPTTTTEAATLTVGDKTLQLPVITGTENEKAIDISKLRSETSYITMDHGYMNTGSCLSSVAFIDGDRGILRYRGIPIEELAEKSSSTETVYLLIYAMPPTAARLDRFTSSLSRITFIHKDMKRFFD